MKSKYRIPKYQRRALTAFIAIWGIFLLGLLILGTLFTLSKIRNEAKITQTQVDNYGKPIIYEQHYFSPQK